MPNRTVPFARARSTDAGPLSESLVRIWNHTMRKQNSIVALAFLLGLIVSSSAAQRSIECHWEGVMVREGAELPVSFDLVSAAAGLTASFNSPTQRAMGIPLRKVSYTAPKVH